MELSEAGPGVEQRAAAVADAACELVDTVTPRTWSKGAVEDVADAIDVLAEALAGIDPEAARALAAVPAATAALRFFGNAAFSRGTVSFDGAAFSGDRVSFSRATFSGGRVSFFRAAFSGGQVYFGDAAFSGGRVSFGSAAFSDSIVSFDRTMFSGGQVYFDGAAFSGGQVYFGGAAFSGDQVSFRIAAFAGGEVSFDRATGSAPSGLLAAVGTPVPATVTLPSDWLPPIP